MEKLKEQIARLPSAGIQDDNKPFKREIHFQVVSELKQIRDPNFGLGDVDPKTGRSMGV